MTEVELRRLLARRESEAIECKPALLSRREMAEYAVGIGNAGGGWLIMGVSDRIPRRVHPVNVPSDDELARIRESVADSAQIHITIEIVPTREGPVLVAQIPARPRGIPFHALARMRLANAANLGVPRIFRDLLSEGKEPPAYWSSDHAVRVTVKGQEARREFLELVQRYPGLHVDHLLVIHYLTRHREVTARTAAELCQRPIEGAREMLGQLVAHWNLLEAGGGAGRGRYYRLSRAVYDLLVGTLKYHVDRRLAIENAKARVLAVLAVLAERPLTNADVREITQMGRNQALWLMKTLEKEDLVLLEGQGRASRWKLNPKTT